MLPSWVAFSAEDQLDERSVEQAVLGVSTRKYRRSLEPLPEGVRDRGTSKSATSRRFVRATKERFHELMSRPLGELNLVALLLDGVHVADHVVLVALGVDAEGRKHVLGLQEGATENSTSCKRLLTDLRERGLSTKRSTLFVIDGGKALRKAIRDVFGKRALVQRCQVHKRRNVLEQLPDRARASVKTALNEAYRCGNPRLAKKLLTNLARRLKEEHPSAASSIEEGLDETLTVMSLGLPAALERTLSTTNAIENLLGICRRVTRNVKRWRGGMMVLRWTAAGLDEAARAFRRLRGYKGMHQLVDALRQRDAELDRSLDDRPAVA